MSSDCKGQMPKEGMSLTRPPWFDGSNYDDWAYRMETFVTGHDYALWHVMKNGPFVPKNTRIIRGSGGSSGLPALKSIIQSDSDEVKKEKEDYNKLVKEFRKKSRDLVVEDNIECFEDLSEDDKRNLSLNARAKNMLHCAVSLNVYGNIKCYKTAKEIWDSLARTYRETTKVKNMKIRLLTKEYESFHMKEGESVLSFQTRLNAIVNNLNGLGKAIPRGELNNKILDSVTQDYYNKVGQIEEVNDINIFPTDELYSRLFGEEQVIARWKNQTSLKSTAKQLAIKAMKSVMIEEDESEDDEEPAMLAKDLKKFLKFRKNKDDSKKFKRFEDKRKSSSLKKSNAMNATSPVTSRPIVLDS